MPCYKPLQAYAAPGGISFNRNQSFGIPIELPCGRCIGCKLENAKSWAFRCICEAEMHNTNEKPDNNCFLTLTYNDESIPEHHSLDTGTPSHFQKFIRSLRKKTKQKIRYYMCGEYGEQLGRPHYHAILFGYTFPDAEFWNSRDGHRVYRSQLLEETWTRGNSEIGTVTFASAGYVARYIMKKQNGELAENHYAVIDKNTGELIAKRKPEYTTMSLKPGIGESWFHKHYSDLYPHDYAVLPDGRTMQVPKYFQRLSKLRDPDLYEKLRKLRIEKAENNPNNTPERLAIRETCQTAKANQLTRQLR